MQTRMELKYKHYFSSWNYFKIISATLNMFKDIHELQWASGEIISGKFRRAEMKLFQSDVDEGWNNFEIIFISHVTTALTADSLGACVVGADSVGGQWTMLAKLSALSADDCRPLFGPYVISFTSYFVILIGITLTIILFHTCQLVILIITTFAILHSLLHSFTQASKLGYFAGPTDRTALTTLSIPFEPLIHCVSKKVPTI